MRDNYDECMDYVERTLKESGRDPGRRHPFRSRSGHTRRVLRWAQRLCEGRTDVDEDVLFLAVIFHDIGYVCDDLCEHAKVSENMFREYAVAHHFEADLIERVASCIRIHSEKERLQNPDSLTIEQILLMEADLLDEEGALAICWDGMACAYEGKYSYAEALERTKLEFGMKENTNPMVTEPGKKYWNDKINYVRDYIKRLEFDLEI